MGRLLSARMNLFRLSLPLIAAVAIAGIAAPESMAGAAEKITLSFFESIDWFFMLTTTGLLLLALYLAMSRHGRIVLGKQGEKPEFSTASWLAMLFAAGMGVGILFWGVAEPMTHFLGAPGSEPGTPASARRALVFTAFHWGLHAWAVYAMAALVLAYFAFRRDKPYLPGAPLRDVFSGRWVEPVARIADLLAVLAITFGVAGSITMGILQLQAGLHIVFGVDLDSMVVASVILVVLVASYMASAATSLDKGIKWLSNINVVIALLLASFVLLSGPTAYLLKTFLTGVGDYIGGLANLSLRLYPYEADQAWIHNWTLTYFIWWIAWAPFVGVFIARISRGRTIRQFILGVVFVPTIFSILWFAVLGGTGLYEDLHGQGGIGSIVREDVTFALFALFERLPLSSVLSVAAVILVFIFLVTSVDSATFVLGMLTSRGSLNPPTNRKIWWGVALGLLGGALLVTRNIQVVRSIAIIGAIPFAFVLVLQVAAFLRALSYDSERESSE